MDLSYSVVEAFCRPKLVFLGHEIKKKIDTRVKSAHESRAAYAWTSTGADSNDWLIDGAVNCGTRFFAFPPSIRVAPHRVDVFIPDQESLPWSVRDALNVNEAVTLRDFAITSKLGISKYISRALAAHCIKDPDWLPRYLELPFGSRIAVDGLMRDPEAADVYAVPNYDIERGARSISYLQDAWKDAISPSSWPEIIELGDLDLVKQLHDSVGIVKHSKSVNAPSKYLVFKSTTEDLSYLYHELKLLLTIPAHPNIISRPLHIVTKKSRFGGKLAVIGFTLRYYPAGSIRDLIPLMDDTHSSARKVDWCRQLLLALIHVQEAAGTFYCDLRPDNVLLSKDEQGNDRLVLCDFEQRGNWHEWCAPEILYPQYVENIRSNRPAAWKPISTEWVELLDTYERLSGSSTRRDKSNTVINSNWQWFALSREQQEKAQVYMVGLIMYCIFEGLSNTRVGITNAYRYESVEHEFPIFRHSPAPIRELIRRCTMGAPQWETSGQPLPRAKRVVRRGHKIYPEGSSTDVAWPEVEYEVLQTGLTWWETELRRSKLFFAEHGEAYGDVGKDRPTLRGVLLELEYIFG